jgi:hypothetical protein
MAATTAADITTATIVAATAGIAVITGIARTTAPAITAITVTTGTGTASIAAIMETMVGIRDGIRGTIGATVIADTAAIGAIRMGVVADIMGGTTADATATNRDRI